MASTLPSGEDSIVQEFLAPLTRGYPGAFGLRDDCALIAPEPGTELVLKTDPVVAGVHFLPSEAPSVVAWKALAVNVSDLIAKGAVPKFYLMALALPKTPERQWMEQFAAGLQRAQEHFGCVLIGGDTDRTPGPLSVSIAAVGVVPAGRMVHRHTARVGDQVFVSGTIGDAALGLMLQRDPHLAASWGIDSGIAAMLDGRLRRPC
ncbi:MAG: thiamine-phosphate kinase, partial [Hyphomicrobiaceae bacterium]